VSATFHSTTSHIGLCVRDLERSRRFYVDGLGFKEFARFDLDRPIAEIEGECHLTSFFVEKNGLRIELLDFQAPKVFGTPSTRRNKLGLTHLSFVVEDVDAAARELE
jgi:catechol 2,3-dioxygenase-like lactoylglutathione lyase family enzyme